MLDANNTAFILVDVQGKLAQLMHDRDRLFDNLQRLVRGMQVLDIPILWAEQNPAHMGKTIPELSALFSDAAPITKMAFSCCGEPRFTQALEALGRKQILVAGIETHVCIYQTAADLLGLGYEVEVVGDAVSSRVRANRQIALHEIRACGARITSVEMALFELLRTAEHPKFRDILAIVR